MSNAMLTAAYDMGQSFIESRDGAGYRFKVTLLNGIELDCVPMSEYPLDAPKDGVLRVEIGNDLAAIPASSILFIQVYEC